MVRVWLSVTFVDVTRRYLIGGLLFLVMLVREVTCKVS